MDIGYGGNYDDNDEPLDESEIVDQLTRQLSRNLLQPSSSSLPVNSTEDQLLRCRLERFEDEEIRKLEEDRLQEIIRLCQSYNESQEGKRVRSLRVNEVDRLLELMKKPDVVQEATSSLPPPPPPTTTIEGNRLVSSMVETSNIGNDSTTTTTVGLTHPTVKDLKVTITESQSNPPMNSKKIEYHYNDSGYNTNGGAVSLPDNCDKSKPDNNDDENNDSDGNNKLTALSIEKNLINNEIDDMKQQTFSDGEDEELKEFQRIEKEIKLNELYKCLETIEQEIVTIKQYQLQQEKQQEQKQLQQHSPSALVDTLTNHQEITVQNKHDLSDNAVGRELENSSVSGSGSGSGSGRERGRGRSIKEAPLASFESDDSSSSDEDVSLGEKVKSADFSRLVQHHQMQNLDNYHTYSTIYSPTSELLDSPTAHGFNFRGNKRDNVDESNASSSRHGSSVDDGIKERQKRPLTIYLPSTGSDLDLIDHIVNLGHDVGTYNHLVQLTPTSCSGYLWKLCSNTENRWRKRYFLFDRQNKVFVYFKSFKSFVKAKKAKYGVYFNQIEDCYVDHNRTKVERKTNLRGSIRRRSNSARHVFVIVTSERNFTLSSFVPEVMRIWIDVIFTGAEGYLSFEP